MTGRQDSSWVQGGLRGRPLPLSAKPLIPVCAAILLLLWALQLNRYLNVANDAGRYMVLGESLARLGQLRLISLPRPLPDTLYPPGFPAIIAFWILVTGKNLGDIVLFVKVTQVVLLLLALPLLQRLFRFAGLTNGYVAVGLLIAAACPSLIYYGNDVMSEVPFLVLCLVSVALVERDTRISAENDRPSRMVRIASLVAAALAYLVRTAAVALLLVQIVWFWKRFGWKWGVLAIAVTAVVAGGWQLRNQRIISHAPPDVHYDTYARQFTLKDPMNPSAGRIQLNAKGIALRIKMGFPTYIGMLPRAVLNTMSVGTWWIWFFYVVAVPLAVLMFVGLYFTARRGLTLSVAFSCLFWVMTALWPWRASRFLVPIVPYLLVFVLVAAQEICQRLARRVGMGPVTALQIGSVCVLFIYFGHSEAEMRWEDNRATVPGYSMGRNVPEAGFYAACAWLQKHGTRGAITMGRPAYILHLYTGLPVTQIEPALNPRGQELAYMRPLHVHYLVEDRWSWSGTEKFLGRYLKTYRYAWKLDFEDRRSGVRVWERLPNAVPPTASPAAPHAPGISAVPARSASLKTVAGKPGR